MISLKLDASALTRLIEESSDPEGFKLELTKGVLETATKKWIKGILTPAVNKLISETVREQLKNEYCIITNSALSSTPSFAEGSGFRTNLRTFIKPKIESLLFDLILEELEVKKLLEIIRDQIQEEIKTSEKLKSEIRKQINLLVAEQLTSGFSVKVISKNDTSE